MSSVSVAKPITTLIPARLDRLRWSPFHTRMVLGLVVVGPPSTSEGSKSSR